MEQQVDVQYQLKAIELVEVRIEPVLTEEKPKEFHFNLSLEHRLVPEQKLIVNMVEITVYGDDKKNILGSVKTAYSYLVNNFDDFVSKEKDKADIPENFLTLLNSVSISTTRGILFSQFRGTRLHSAILPILDPSTLVKNPE